MLVERGPGVVFREDTFQTRVVAFDGDHRVVHQLADRRQLRLRLEVCPARFLGHPEHVLRAVLVRVLGVRAAIVPLAGGKLRVMLLERIRDVLQEDQPEHHMLVLGGVHVVPQLIGREPQLRLEAQVRRAASVGRLPWPRPRTFAFTHSSFGSLQGVAASRPLAERRLCDAGQLRRFHGLHEVGQLGHGFPLKRATS